MVKPWSIKEIVRLTTTSGQAWTTSLLQGCSKYWWEAKQFRGKLGWGTMPFWFCWQTASPPTSLWMKLEALCLPWFNWARLCVALKSSSLYRIKAKGTKCFHFWLNLDTLRDTENFSQVLKTPYAFERVYQFLGVAVFDNSSKHL